MTLRWRSLPGGFTLAGVRDNPAAWGAAVQVNHQGEPQSAARASVGKKGQRLGVRTLG